MNNINANKIRLSIILPTYRERRNIPNIIQRIFDNAQDFDLEILIVDDDSKDGTAKVVKKMAQVDSLIVHQSDPTQLVILRKSPNNPMLKGSKSEPQSVIFS